MQNSNEAFPPPRCRVHQPEALQLFLSKSPVGRRVEAFAHHWFPPLRRTGFEDQCNMKVFVSSLMLFAQRINAGWTPQHGPADKTMAQRGIRPAGVKSTALRSYLYLSMLHHRSKFSGESHTARCSVHPSARCHAALTLSDWLQKKIVVWVINLTNIPTRFLHHVMLLLRNALL